MGSAIQASQALVALGFVALGVATAVQWYQRRDRAQAMLALSLCLLAVTAAIGRIQVVTGPGPFLGAVALVSFLASGYFVLLFRDAFLPLRPNVRRAATGLLVVSSLIGIASVTALASAGSTVTSAISLFLVLTWGVFILEPVVRFWLASRSQPSVQRTRMRALSFGFTALMAILLVSVLGGAAVRSQVATLVIQLIALAVVPVIYVSFAPPALLRRIWRMGEESKLRAAIQDLLIFSPGPQALAEQAVGWAIRLMGAQSAFIVNHAGGIIASRNIGAEEVREILARRSSEFRETLVGPGGSTAIVVPLHLTEGAGCLGVVSGSFTPIFGNDEINQLEGYASSVAAGIERTRVTERIAAIERHKTQFLNLASHELRGPLTVIRGYGSMLQSGLLGDLNERGLRAAPVMMAKILEMNALIEQMIEAARLEDGALTIKSQPADLREIVAAAVAKVEPVLTEAHHIKVVAPARAVRVAVDHERIQTIITNLIDNAVKYSPDGGEISCTVTSRGGVARVIVKDNGIGIAKDDLPILFTRFGRVSNATTDHFPGTGLGLYLGRQLARLHGGEITVDSAPGEGSTFTLHLPVSDRAQSARTAELSTSGVRGKAVVDS